MDNTLQPGARVQFYNLMLGSMTGSLLDFIENSVPPRAVVMVDHRLNGVYQAVPIQELSPLQPVLA